ncbi:MAG: hypothetical protein D6705_02905 [Deltaproteobacteria bacterium]|nr:MAG: hypothetical protein D6705_02905 [Deltaproteobacteria bacterium]
MTGLGRIVFAVAVSAMASSAWARGSSDDAEAATEAAERVATLVRRLAALEHGAAALSAAGESMAYARGVLAYERSEGVRKLRAYRVRRAARAKAARRRGRALYKLSRGGVLRILFEEDAEATSARTTKARTIRFLVRHDLRELAVYRDAERRAGAELAGAVRTTQALGALAVFATVQGDFVEGGREVLERGAAEARRRMRRARRRGAHLPAAVLRTLRAEERRLRRARRNLLRPRGLVRPVRGRIVGRFGPYEDPVLRIPAERLGVEIAGRPGRPVRAIAPGKVVFVGEIPAYGLVVVLDHGEGFLSITGRLVGITVAPEDEVEAGAVVGRVGPKSVDDGLGPTVYLEVRHGTRPIDPAPYLARLGPKTGR